MKHRAARTSRVIGRFRLRRFSRVSAAAVLGACAVTIVLLATAGAVSGQFIYRGAEGRYRQPITRGLPEYRGGFMFCRLWYDENRRMDSGLGWSTDYPASENNFMARLEELTSTPINMWRDGTLGFAAVRATDPELFHCPFLFMTDPGSVDFTDAEVEGLRQFLLKGGFLWADDMWGDYAWGFLQANLQRILPGYEIVDLTPDHPLFSAHYVVKRIPQIPALQRWSGPGSPTAECGPPCAVPHLRAIFDDNGRLLVLISHNTDIADGWEREADNRAFFYTFSPEAYAIGINVALWIMSR